MYGLEKCKDIKIDTANGSKSMVTYIGYYKGKAQCADGTENIIILKNVKVLPGLVKNLFSLSTVMHNDWDLLTGTTDDTKVLKIKKNDVEYISTKRHGKIQMEDILWEWNLYLTKSMKKKKKKIIKMTTKIKILRNKIKETLAHKLVKKSTSMNYMKNWDIQKNKLQN